MTSEKKPSNDISNALDKVDQEVARIRQDKLRESKRLKRQAPPVEKEIDRHEVIKEQNLQDQKNIIEDIKSRAIMISLIFVTTILLTYSLTKKERVTLIEQVVFLFLWCGIVLAHAKKR